MEKRIQSPHFFLHYYGYHDRPLQEFVVAIYKKMRHPTLSSVFMTFMNGVYQFPSLVTKGAAPVIPSSIANDNVDKRSKLRIVFFSSHLGGNEPHGLLIIDVIRRLPSRIFECIAIGVGTKAPSQEFIAAVNGNYFGVGTNDHRAVELLAQLAPDCLVFGEVMNEGMLYFLAQNRFAPIQVLLMGAPVTSGFTTIDYFISGDRVEHVSNM